MRHDRLTIAVHVHPGAPRAMVGGAYGDALVVRVASRAVQGAANDEVLTVLADAFGLRRHQVAFARVTSSRDKRVVLEGPTQALHQRLHELRGDAGARP